MKCECRIDYEIPLPGGATTPIVTLQKCPLCEAAPELYEACKAVLMFHRGGPWEDNDAEEWKRLTGQEDATTKVLCNTVRAAIAKAGII